MIFLCEFEVHDGTSTSKLYVGTHGIRSGPTDTPANQYYEPRLASVGRIERAMFASGDGVSSGTTGGQSEVGFGNISVLNGTPYGEADLIDHWKNLAFRSVTIKSLTGESQSYAQATTRFVGTIENLVSTNPLERYDLILHDRLQDFDKPLLTHVYLGTTNFGVGAVSGGGGDGDGDGDHGGIEPPATTTTTSTLSSAVEGDTDLKDQVKQKIWGTVHNVAAIAVNPFDLVWQVSDGEVASIVVYDGGVALTNAGNVSTLEALFSTVVAAGFYLTCTSLGLFILGSPPIGTVTADVVEGATAAARTAGQIASRMAAWFQLMYPHLSVSLTSSDVTALDALNSAECGILVQDTESGLGAITRVLNSIGAWMLPRSSSTSMFDLGRMDLATGSSVATYDFEDNLGGNPERIESGDDSRGVPAWKVTVRYDQLGTVQTAGDLFGVVTENDPIRVQYLATEWRQASVENAGILAVWPNAPTITTDTRLTSQAAAQAEAARLFAMHSVQRDIWRIRVPMSDDPADDPGIGEVVELTSRNGRMGLGREIGLGTIFRVLGRVDDYDDVPMLELTLWGAPAVVAVPPTVIAINAVLAATEAADIANVTGSMPTSGTLVTTETADIASIAGTVPVVGLDSDVSAWVSAVTGAGGSVSGDYTTGRQKLVNDLVTGLKADGVWDKLDRLWLFASENSQSALIDLKALTTATASGAPTFTTDRGYTGAASKYIDTGFIPSSSAVNFTLNSACFFVWNNTAGVVTNALVGSDTANRNKLYPEHATNDTRWSVNTISATGSTITGITGDTGLWAVNRTASNANQLYRNGSSIATSTNASNSLHTGAIFVFRDATIYTTRQACCFGAGASLDATEQANLYTHIRTYMTAVGVP